MNAFVTVLLRNFVGSGLPSKNLYIVVSYVLNKTLKMSRTHIVAPRDDFIWKDYEFKIDVSREEFYNGNIFIELYSKSFIKDTFVGSVKINMIDDVLIQEQFKLSYCPFTMNGQAKLIDSNMTSTFAFPTVKNNVRTPTGKLNFFFGISGFKLTKHIFNDSDGSKIASIIASMQVFMTILAEMQFKYITMDMIEIDVEGIEYYINNDIYTHMKPLFTKSMTSRCVFDSMTVYNCSNRNFAISQDKVYDLSFDKLIRNQKDDMLEIYRSGSFVSPRDLKKMNKIHLPTKKLDFK